MASNVVVRGNTRSIDWSAAIWSSIIAGVVFAVIEMALAWAVKGQSPWAPLHMIGAIGLGRDALNPPDTFDLTIISTAVGIHFALAIIYGVVLAFLVQRLDTGWAVGVGALYGFALYVINFYGFTRLFPWFVDARDWVSIVSHIVQSGLMAWIYKGMSQASVSATKQPFVERRSASRLAADRAAERPSGDLRDMRNVPLV
jgi:hypothetical protein